MSGGIRNVWECVRAWTVTCRVSTCCCVAPLRIGLMAIGYLNIIGALVMVVGTASGVEMFSPMVARVQAAILEDEASKVWVLAPVADLAANTVLLCALYRNDVKLCRLFMYFCAASMLASVIVYAIVVVTIELLNLIIIALSLAYQAYVMILVRSYVIEIKLREVADKSKFTYDNRYGTLTITDITEPNTEIRLKDVKLEILDGKDTRGNTLTKSSTLKSNKSNTIGSNKSSRANTLNRFESVSDETPVSSKAEEITKQITTQDASVSVTPVDIIASRAYLINSERIKKDITPTVKDSPTTTAAVIETVKEVDENVKGDAVNTNKLTKTDKAEANKTEDLKVEIPQKKKRGIFSKKLKNKETKKEDKNTDTVPAKSEN